ncbi:MAG: serine protease [Proteobacteria bacterium]|nr:serine protease [Pseudomonadota bacterium]
MNLKVFHEQVFFTTVRIVVANQNAAGSSIGTGFLYKVPVTPDQTCILLISNKHVYGDGKTPIQLVFHKKDVAQTGKPDLGQTVTLRDNSFQSVYTTHPDSIVDLACINVSKIGNEELSIFFKTLDDNLLADFNHEQLLPGNEVWFIGYPENRFDTKHNLPILRHGYIASIPKIDFEGQRQFLIDAQVFQGSSGSPVFTTLGNQFKLIGVVARTMIKNEKLQSIPTATVLSVPQVIGLGIVLKSTLLVELLETATRTIKERLSQNKEEPTQNTETTGEQVDGADAATHGPRGST